MLSVLEWHRATAQKSTKLAVFIYLFIDTFNVYYRNYKYLVPHQLLLFKTKNADWPVDKIKIYNRKCCHHIND